MAFYDIREYLEVLEKEGELTRVRKQVDPKYEVSAICKTAHQRGRKALLFDRVRGCSMPVITELFSTFRRVGLALETDEGICSRRWRSGRKQQLIQ